MFRCRTILATALALTIALFAGPLDAIEVSPIWRGFICSAAGGHGITYASYSGASLPPVAQCSPMPAGFTELPSVGTGGNTSVSLQIGFDPDTQHLCYVSTSLPEAPVLRVGAGGTLAITIANTSPRWRPISRRSTGRRPFTAPSCFPNTDAASPMWRRNG